MKRQLAEVYWGTNWRTQQLQISISYFGGVKDFGNSYLAAKNFLENLGFYYSSTIAGNGGQTVKLFYREVEEAA